MVARPEDFSPRPVPPQPERTGFVGVLPRVRCPACGGNIQGDGVDLACMMCARSLQATAVDGSRIIRVSTTWRAPETRRVGDGESQRTTRGVSESQGSTGLAARILAAVPEAPDHITAWALGRPLRILTEEVRAILAELIDLGLVVEVTYRAGCVETRTSRGYQRPRLEDDDAAAV